MGNDVSLFVGGNNLAIPEHLRGVELDDQTRKLAGSGGGLRISIKGGVFRMLNGGEEIAKNDDRAMNVIVVNSSPDTARTFYADAYVEGGDAKPPSCWSIDGVKPDAEVKVKQSATCATCPQNVAGSGQNESRACRYSRNLAVTLEGDIAGKVFKLNLPAASIFGKPENGVMPLQAYAKQLVAHNIPVAAVVTELRFDTTVATPKLGFKAVRYLNADEYEIAKAQGQTPEALEAVRTTVFQQDAAGAEKVDIAGVNPAGANTPNTAVPAAAAAPETPAVIAHPATVAATAPVTAPKRTRAKPAGDAAGAAPAAQTAPPATVSQPAAAATAPATATAPAAGAITLPNGQVVDPAMMAAIMAAMAGQGVANLTPAAATHQEPQVLPPSVTEGPPPVGAAAMLSKWDEEEA